MSATITPISAHAAHVFDVVIVGAGLCGLALARTLAARGLSFQVLDARPRLGGRAHTQTCPQTGQALDLGPTWFWPDTEPRIAALLHSLNLPSVTQHDPGDALWLTDPSQGPERRPGPAGGIHVGAQRIAGGVERLVAALAAELPAHSLRLNTPVRRLHDRGSHIEIWPQVSAGGTTPLRARQVVLALPPRLVAEHIQCEPPLPSTVQIALEAAPTWMAAQAKAVTTFAQPFWREAGHSGNAFVRHHQAVLAEVFDLSLAPAGALGGFIALTAAQRPAFRKSLPLLIESQLVQLYGQAAQDGHLFWMDWADEPWTCSSADRASTPPAPVLADSLLRRPHWGQRLHLGGSETATHGAGHMEGALEAADRIAHSLLAQAAQLRHSAIASTPRNAATPASHASALARFDADVQALRAAAPERYRQHLTRLLASQQSDELTQRALLAAADQTYSAALLALDGVLPELDMAQIAPSDASRHPLTPTLLAAFSGWNQTLMDAALAHNRSSCALSNFPLEHDPDAALRRAISLDLAAAWREFALELNTRLQLALPTQASAA